MISGLLQEKYKVPSSPCLQERSVQSLDRWFRRGGLRDHSAEILQENTLANVTVHEKTGYKSKIAILDNAHLKVQTLCCFTLKSDLPSGENLPSGEKITSVVDNEILFSACSSSLLLLICSAET